VSSCQGAWVCAFEHTEVIMPKLKTPALVIPLYTVAGAVLGGWAFRILLSPGNQYACTQKLLDTTGALDRFAQARGFGDPCLNALGGMATGYDPALLFLIGAVVMGAVGFLIGRFVSRSPA
jgi:hypothetical protein